MMRINTKVSHMLTFAGLLTAAGPVSAASSQRPNFIWIMAEDMGLDLECYGMAGVHTPNLNRLAEEGIKFKRAYCTNPICSPSRSAMMVGTHQNIINAQHHRSNRDAPLAISFKPFTYWLRQAGYTCILGNEIVMKNGRKIDCNFKHEPIGTYDGIKDFGLFDKLDCFNAEDQPFFNQIQCVVTHRGDWWNKVRSESKHPVSTDAVKLPPWFADTPEIRYDWAAYLDTVEYMDNEVGLIMKRLEEGNLEKNTYLIFIADNGRCNLRGKGYLQETGIHVPMIVRGPGIQAGNVVDELVSMTDITATILKLAGAEMPDYLDGHPVFGVDNPQYREYIYSARDIWDEIDDCSRSITTKKFSYIRNYMPEVPWDAHQAYLDLNRPAIHVMRSLKEQGRLTAAEMMFMADRKPVEELYDIEKDPDQTNNLADNPEYVTALKKMRSYEKDWQSKYHDRGLDDLGRRQPEKELGAIRIRKEVMQNHSELWSQLEGGRLMETQSWEQYLPEKKNMNVKTD